MADWETEYEKEKTPAKISHAKPALSWETEYEKPVPNKEEPSKSGFVPRIGGVLSKDEEKYTNPKYLLAAGLGGTVTRGIPGIRDLIPMTQNEQTYARENPTVASLGDISGKALSALPAAGVGATLGLPGYMGAQAAINTGVGAADTLFHNPSATPTELKNNAMLDAIGGAAGPVVGKVLSPFAANLKSAPANMTMPNTGLPPVFAGAHPPGMSIPNMAAGAPTEGVAQGLARNASMSRARDVVHSGVDTVLPHMNVPLYPAVEKGAKLGVDKWITNQLMTPANRAKLTAGMSAVEREKLRALQGEQ